MKFSMTIFPAVGVVYATYIVIAAMLTH